MTLDEARQSIGRGVVYTPRTPGPASRPEDGIITSVGSEYVFVRFAALDDGQAVRPGDLELLRRPS